MDKVQLQSHNQQETFKHTLFDVSKTTFAVAAFAGVLITLIGGLVLGGLYFPHVANYFYIVAGYIITPAGGIASVSVGFVVLSVSTALVTLIVIKQNRPKETPKYTDLSAPLEAENDKLKLELEESKQECLEINEKNVSLQEENARLIEELQNIPDEDESNLEETEQDLAFIES